MTDKTNKHTIVLEDGVHLIEVVYSEQDHTVEASMYTRKTRPILLYAEMFQHHVDYAKKAVEECSKMIQVYDYIVGLQRDEE